MRFHPIKTNDFSTAFGANSGKLLAQDMIWRISMLIRASILLLAATFLGCSGSKQQPRSASSQRARLCRSDDTKDCQTQCDRGSLPSCVRLSQMLQLGAGGLGNQQQIEQVARRIVVLSRQECGSNSAEACLTLAGAVFHGRGGAPKDVTKAMSLLGKACQLGSVDGCYALGALHLQGGQGVKSNPARSTQLLSKACTGGHQQACSLLAACYLHGHGVAPDPQRSARLFTNACRQEVPNACANLSAMYISGKGVAKDIRAGLFLMQRACVLGHVPACQQLVILDKASRSKVKSKSKRKRKRKRRRARRRARRRSS